MSVYWIIFGKLIIWSERVNPGSRRHEENANLMFSLSQVALVGGTANLAAYFFDFGSVNKVAAQLSFLLFGGVLFFANFVVSGRYAKLEEVVRRLKHEEGFIRNIKSMFVTLYVVFSFLYVFVVPLVLVQ